MSASGRSRRSDEDRPPPSTASTTVIFDEPVIRRTGDLALTVEFGDEISLPVSFRVIAMAQWIAGASEKAVVETIPTHRSIGVVVDSEELGTEGVQSFLDRAIDGSRSITELESRVVNIPMLYDDPWSRDCAADNSHPNSFEEICKANDMSHEELRRTHSSTDYWVGAVGFTPGCTQAFPLDDSKLLVAPKTPVPRTWTYPRIVALGGRLTAPYTVRSPGGYQMLGRTPLDWYDPTKKNPTYGDEITLCRVGDRQRFRPIDLQTYEEIREAVILGTYEYEIEHETVTLEDLQRAGAAADSSGNGGEE